MDEGPVIYLHMDSKHAPRHGNQDRGPTLDALSWSLAVVSLISCTARIYGRVKLTRNIWWDDWFILLTVAMAFAFTIIGTIYAHAGGGRHAFYLSQTTREFALKLNWISQSPGILAIAMGKISVAFLILRIVPQDRLRRWLLYIGAGTIAILLGCQCIMIYAQCRPPRALWMFNVDGKCWPPEVIADIGMVLAGYSAVLDIAFPAIAISMFWSSTLPTQKKISLTLIMSAGVLACAAAIIKITKLPDLNARNDFTWNTVDLFVWNTVEVNTTIIAACIPTLKPVYRVMTGKPGAEVYTRRYKESRRTPSSRRERFTELRDMEYVASQEIAHDGTELSCDHIVSRPESIRQTFDVEIITNDTKYPSQNESTAAKMSSIV